MSKPQQIKQAMIKSVILLIGLFFSALSVSLSIKSRLGASPVGVCPAVFSPYFKISTGTGTAILLAIFFAAQVVILKTEFQFRQFLQLPLTVIYGIFIDLTSKMLSVITLKATWHQVVFSALAIISLALGVFIMLKSRSTMLPQDAFVYVICEKYDKEYGKTKILLDSILTAVALIGSLIIYRGFVQVGIGTVAGAVFVGRIIRRLNELEGINILLDRATGEIRKDTEYGSAEYNISVASEDE